MTGAANSGQALGIGVMVLGHHYDLGLAVILGFVVVVIGYVGSVFG